MYTVFYQPLEGYVLISYIFLPIPEATFKLPSGKNYTSKQKPSAKYLVTERSKIGPLTQPPFGLKKTRLALHNGLY